MELGSLQFMPKLQRHVGEAGAVYRRGYTTSPMCCPSRSSLLTGLYVHNHHVFTNNHNCSSRSWRHTHEQRTFAPHLQVWWDVVEWYLVYHYQCTLLASKMVTLGPCRALVSKEIHSY